MVHDVPAILEHPTSGLLESWLSTALRQVLDNMIATTPTVKVDRETLWSLFHQLRSETAFQLSESNFWRNTVSPMSSYFMSTSPQRYEFSALLTQWCDVEVESPFEETTVILTPSLNYEEENTVKYICRWVHIESYHH